MLPFHHKTAELKVLTYMSGSANVLAFNQYFYTEKERFYRALRTLNLKGEIMQIVIFAQNAFYETRSLNLDDHTPVKQQYNSYHNKKSFSRPFLEDLFAISLRSALAR